MSCFSPLPRADQEEEHGDGGHHRRLGHLVPHVALLQRLGGEVVGMTMPREAKLCAELGVPYAALLIATNWAAGRHPGDATKALSHDEVSAESSKRTASPSSSTLTARCWPMPAAEVQRRATLDEVKVQSTACT